MRTIEPSGAFVNDEALILILNPVSRLEVVHLVRVANAPYHKPRERRQVLLVAENWIQCRSRPIECSSGRIGQDQSAS